MQSVEGNLGGNGRVYRSGAVQRLVEITCAFCHVLGILALRVYYSNAPAYYSLTCGPVICKLKRGCLLTGKRTQSRRNFRGHGLRLNLAGAAPIDRRLSLYLWRRGSCWS